MGPWIPVGARGGGQQLEGVQGHVLELRLAPVCARACTTVCACDVAREQADGPGCSSCTSCL
jgi:hypothetical protein